MPYSITNKAENPHKITILYEKLAYLRQGLWNRGTHEITPKTIETPMLVHGVMILVYVGGKEENPIQNFKVAPPSQTWLP
jgi:hypothetical protein